LQTYAPPLAVAEVASGYYAFTPATNSSFVNDYIKWMAQVTDASSEYTEAAALAVLSAVVGGRLRVPVSVLPKPIPCNLYVALLGASTNSRKSTVMRWARHLVEEITEDVLIDEPGSPEALVQELQQRELEGAAMFVDELTWWFSAVKSKLHMADMRGFVMRAYDGDKISRRNRTKKVQGVSFEDRDVVSNPALTIFSAATPDKLGNISVVSDIEDGWWPRFALIWPTHFPPEKPLSAPSPVAISLQASITAHLQAAHERVAQGIKAQFMDESWDAYEEYRRSLIASRPEDEPIFARSDLRVIKVAALLALMDNLLGAGDIVVQRKHVLDATILVMRWLQSSLKFAAIVGETEFENQCRKALAALERLGGSAPVRDIYRAIHVDARRMDLLERTMHERGMIVVKQGNGKTWELVTRTDGDAFVTPSASV
jgi:hypothetical protein